MGGNEKSIAGVGGGVGKGLWGTGERDRDEEAEVEVFGSRERLEKSVTSRGRGGELDGVGSLAGGG